MTEYIVFGGCEETVPTVYLYTTASVSSIDIGYTHLHGTINYLIASLINIFQLFSPPCLWLMPLRYSLSASLMTPIIIKSYVSTGCQYWCCNSYVFIALLYLALPTSIVSLFKPVQLQSIATELCIRSTASLRTLSTDPFLCLCSCIFFLFCI